MRRAMIFDCDIPWRSFLLLFSLNADSFGKIKIYVSCCVTSPELKAHRWTYSVHKSASVDRNQTDHVDSTGWGNRKLFEDPAVIYSQMLPFRYVKVKKHFFLRTKRWFEPRHEKTCLCHMRTTKAQFSLRIRAVWSTPLMFAAWIV